MRGLGTTAAATWLGLALVAVAAARGANEAEEGQALAAELRRQKPAESAEFNGLLKRRDGNGRRTEIPVRFHAVLGESSWQAIYETQPGPQAAVEKLIVVHSDDQPNQYFLWRTSGTGAALAQAAPCAQPMTPFAGSDFWLADLGMEFLHWPEQRLVKREMRRGRPCKTLESTNPKPAPGGYARVRCWIDTETEGILRAEAYDTNNKLLKEFSVGSFKKVQGRWELQDLEIRNERTDSRTRLEFNM